MIQRFSTYNPNEKINEEFAIFNKPDFDIVIDLSKDVKFEDKAKHFAIFKRFFLKDKNSGKKLGSFSTDKVLFGEWKEDENSDVVIIDQLIQFDSYQEVYNYATTKELVFF